MDGQELRRRREALGLSQAELGRRLGIMQNTVSRWELGLVVIRHPKMLDLALEAIETRKTRTAMLDAMYAARKAKEAGDG